MTLSLQALLAYPVLSYVITSKRFKRRPHARLAVGLAIVLLLVLVQYWQLASSWEPNYFEVLQVWNSASLRDVKAAFRKLSLEAHPDRGGGSEEAFLLISKAHTVLVNDESREAYNRWGDLGLKWLETSQSALVNGWTALGVQAMVHFVFVFITTVSVGDTNARSYGFAVLGLYLALAVQLRFGEEDPLEMWGSKTRDQKCAALFSSLSTVLVALCVFQRATFRNAEVDFKARLERIEHQQAVLMRRTKPRKVKKTIEGEGEEGEHEEEEEEEEDESKIRVSKLSRTRQQQELAGGGGNPLLNLPSWAYLLAFMAVSSYFN